MYFKMGEVCEEKAGKMHTHNLKSFIIVDSNHEKQKKKKRKKRLFTMSLQI